MSLKNAPCRPERSEGSCSPGTEMRFAEFPLGASEWAQHDKGDVLYLPDQVQVIGSTFEGFAELWSGNFDEAVRALG